MHLAGLDDLKLTQHLVEPWNWWNHLWDKGCCMHSVRHIIHKRLETFVLGIWNTYGKKWNREYYHRYYQTTVYGHFFFFSNIHKLNRCKEWLYSVHCHRYEWASGRLIAGTLAYMTPAVTIIACQQYPSVFIIKLLLMPFLEKSRETHTIFKCTKVCF